MMQIHLHRPAAFLRAEGEDIASFLQGQFTNELRQTAGRATYGLFLNQKGKVLADSFVLKLDEKNFVVTSSFSPADLIRKRLEEYVVADDVTLIDETDRVCGLAVWGAGCESQLKDLLGVEPAAGRFGQSRGLVVFAGRRTKEENYEIIGPEKQISELRERLQVLGVGEANAPQVEFLRIAEGIPAVPKDIGAGDLPNEGDLDDSAISYTKGCYLGQEVMARLKNLGQVRRRLFVLWGRGSPPEPHTPLYQQGRKVGEMRSIASQGTEVRAMAMLSLLNLNEAGGLSLGPDAPPNWRIVPHG